jgi:hypothetical protein
MSTAIQEEKSGVIEPAQDELLSQGFVRWEAMSDQLQSRLAILAERLRRVQRLGGAFADVRLAPELEAAMAGESCEIERSTRLMVH